MPRGRPAHRVNVEQKNDDNLSSTEQLDEIVDSDELSLDDIESIKFLAPIELLIPIFGAPMAGFRLFSKGEVVRDKELIKFLILNNAPIEIYC